MLCIYIVERRLTWSKNSKMSKPDQNYTVIREYKNLYDMEELIRRIIRTHIGRIQEGKEKAEGAESRE